MKKVFYKFLLPSFIVCVVAGCMPRGESHSLDVILSDAKSRYTSASSVTLKPEVSDKIKLITTSLDQLSSDSTSDGSKLSNDIADALGAITPFAGTTNRPALYELSLQLKTIAEKKESMPLNERKLIASRVYGALATELETVKFGFA